MITDIKGLLEYTLNKIKEFTDIAVIGLSGGADSTLVATLCSQALGSDNVYGIHMPSTEIDLKTFNSTSRKLSAHLGIVDVIIPICGPIRLIQESVKTNLWKGAQNHLMNDLTKGNMKARIRMTVLYTIAEEINKTINKKVRVIGTDNLNENFIGYFTKYGDGGVDINPIGELFKSEVYQLLDYYILNNIIKEEHVNRIPSAGLWEDQTDENELGFSYKDMEESIKYYYNNIFYGDDDPKFDSPCYKFVINMMKTNSHKNIIPRKFDLRKFCDWIGYDI
jgi:NAD+ synthase